MAKYEYATEESHAGTIRKSERKVVNYDLTIEPDYSEPATEYTITLNGRLIRRFTAYQAARLGLTK